MMMMMIMMGVVSLSAALVCLIEGVQFTSQLVTMLTFLWFSSTAAGKCWDYNFLFCGWWEWVPFTVAYWSYHMNLGWRMNAEDWSYDRWWREREVLRINHVLVPLCLSEISHELNWDQTQTCALRSWQLTTWHMAWEKFLDMLNYAHFIHLYCK
jgi:hypothetical protein